MPACFLNIQPRNPYIPLHMIAIMLDIKCCGDRNRTCFHRCAADCSTRGGQLHD
ncbi:hypothetical protein KGB39_gp90 [Salmonella phage Skate]|uniref:Uncharacterized protein n=1 Tax=Salmonella phage Skate TaxID=2234035 RepID=A0A2Z5HS45_9CAUD|nr:hypothetical protein KGB39_gp90 [Salmonella phage Skate]AXC43011.1 hypothetical protein CPT_Skate_053 [Salmonella phage Skate]